jgi:guanylate kinase
MGRGKRNHGQNSRRGIAPSATSPASSLTPVSVLAYDRVVQALDTPPESGVARDPSLVVLVGVSGAGKDTLIKNAGDQRELRKPISATSRPPREGEQNGVDYNFFSREEFEQKAAAGDMFEWAEFNGNYYGTLLSELEGEGLRLAIREDQGAKEMKERLGCVVVGVFPPSPESVRDRMLARGDKLEDVEARLRVDAVRTENIRTFADYIVTNDDLDEATAGFVELLDRLEDGAVPGTVQPQATTADPLGPGSYGMQSSAGEAAVEELMERLYLSLEPDVDLDTLGQEVADGVALIATMHPEAQSASVQAAIQARLDHWLSELGIGSTPGV